MGKQKPMGKVPSLGGSPAQQAMNNAMGGTSRPMRSPGKPAKSIKGTPAGPSSTQKAKKPKGRAKPTLKKGNIKGITKKAVANIKSS